MSNLNQDKIGEKSLKFTIEDFETIHTLTILYCSFASSPYLTDSSLDTVILRLQSWDFKISKQKKDQEILKALTWFSKEYSPDLFSILKQKFSLLEKLSKTKKIKIVKDLREISATLFSLTEQKLHLYHSIIAILNIETTDYDIKIISEKIIDQFNDKIDFEYKSIILEKFVEYGMIVVLSIDVNDLQLSIKTGDFNELMLKKIGTVDLKDWLSLEKLITKEEIKIIKKDFKDVSPDFIVLMYCQGKYIHAFASE